MKEYGEAKFQVHSFLNFALDYSHQPEASVAPMGPTE